MTVKEFLDKELSVEEANELLKELLGYSCNYEYPVRYVKLQVFDEEGDPVNAPQLIGQKDLHIVKNILFLKEKVDEERGLCRGISRTQTIIKTALGITS